jgi:hypothetical protein
VVPTGAVEAAFPHVPGVLSLMWVKMRELGRRALRRYFAEKYS